MQLAVAVGFEEADEGPLPLAQPGGGAEEQVGEVGGADGHQAGPPVRSAWR